MRPLLDFVSFYFFGARNYVYRGLLLGVVLYLDIYSDDW